MTSRRCIPVGCIYIKIISRDRIELVLPGCDVPECHPERHTVLGPEAATALAEQLLDAAHIVARLNAQPVH